MSLVLKEVYNKANTIHDDTSIIKSRECAIQIKKHWIPDKKCLE